MPIIKSAKKRVKVTRRATAKNLRTKRILRSAVKEVRLGLNGNSSPKLEAAKRKVQSALDKAGKKGIMSKHKVARKQKQLAAQIKASGLGKPAAKKTAAKKAPAKPKTAKK